MKNSPKKNNKTASDDRKRGILEKQVRRVSPIREKMLDERLGLQTISIRLQKNLIDNLKTLAKEDGIGYQPYVRQLLTRHVKKLSSEKRKNMRHEKRPHVV